MSDSSSKVPKFVPDPNKTSARIYANFASIRSTGLDYTISFADVTPPTPEETEKAKKGEPIQVALQCEIVIPNYLVPSLIDALKKQYERNEAKQTEAKPVSNVFQAKPKR